MKSNLINPILTTGAYIKWLTKLARTDLVVLDDWGWWSWIGDAAIADAMLDRLLQQSHRLVLKDESLRAQSRSRTPKTPV